MLPQGDERASLHSASSRAGREGRAGLRCGDHKVVELGHGYLDYADSGRLCSYQDGAEGWAPEDLGMQ